MLRIYHTKAETSLHRAHLLQLTRGQGHDFLLSRCSQGRRQSLMTDSIAVACAWAGMTVISSPRKRNHPQSPSPKLAAAAQRAKVKVAAKKPLRNVQQSQSRSRRKEQNQVTWVMFPKVKVRRKSQPKSTRRKSQRRSERYERRFGICFTVILMQSQLNRAAIMLAYIMQTYTCWSTSLQFVYLSY